MSLGGPGRGRAASRSSERASRSRHSPVGSRKTRGRRMGESGERVTVEIRDHVADVRLNRPDKLNALDPAMFDELIGAGQRLVADMTVRAVILSGEGRGFCAGLDMESFAAVA